jgi:acetyl-CoA C-acetyltransferase
VSVTGPQLGAVAIKSALEKSKVPVSKISDVYMGNVLQGSVGQAPARQASIFAGLPPTVEATTINKVCASGLKAVALAAQNIQLGLAEAQIAGGFENMSRVPYYVPRASGLPAFGHVKMEDGLIKDGLTDVYDQIHMGNCAENTAKKYDISRAAQDEYAIQSYQRAQAAWKNNAFADEIAPVTVKGRKGDTIITTDEGFLDVKLEKIPSLKPAFVRDGTGTVTAANSSTLNDGGSALVLGSKAIAQEYGAGSRVLARICGSADAAVDPIDFPIAPAKAVPIALERAGITKDQVAVWEFNEAFAAVIKANEKVRITRTLSPENPLTAVLDSWPRGRAGEPARWSHFAGPCPRQLGLAYPGDAAPSAQARRVRCCGHLQRRRRGDGHGCAEDRVGVGYGTNRASCRFSYCPQRRIS